MTTILLAAVAIAAQAQTTSASGWELKAPYQEKDDLKYAINIDIDAAGNTMRVEMSANYKISKKTDKGFEGSFGWTNLYVEGEMQPDESFSLMLKSNGTLKSVKSDYGDGMRRMLLPFFFSYPEKAVAKDATWTYADTSDEAMDGHTAKCEYKVVGMDKFRDAEVMKVSVSITETGPTPMKGSGFYWIGKDGKLVKFDIDVTEWTVPVAGQAFNAKLKGELAK